VKRRLAIASTVAVLATGGSLALAGSQPITGGIVGSGVLTHKQVTVRLSGSDGFVMEWAKLAPGASFGWHWHHRPVVVAVTAGTLTVYDSSDPGCKAVRYSAGGGFIEPSNHVHVARNEGSKPVSLYAVYLGVPAEWRANPTPLDVYVKTPGNCPADIR
jgi:quercetin dioxygenase-like cupin family protein